MWRRDVTWSGRTHVGGPHMGVKCGCIMLLKVRYSLRYQIICPNNYRLDLCGVTWLTVQYVFVEITGAEGC